MSEADWPERLTLRDTKIVADEGQRIFTTATGYGYEKREYVRADRIAELEAEVARLQDQIYESIPKWQANDLQRKLDDAEAEVARLRIRTAPTHHKDCEWHVDQYPWECTCGQSRAEAAEARAKALEDALREAIEFADQDAMALTPAGYAMIARWRAALLKEETP